MITWKKLDPPYIIDSCKSIRRLSSTIANLHQIHLLLIVPKSMSMSILRDDRWYTEILDTLFDYTLKHTHKALDTRFVGKPLFRWISANFHTTVRQATRRIVLHPHVHLYRVRAELGRMDWQTLHSCVATNLLDLMNKEPPNVFGTYLLHGQCQPNSSDLQ